MALTIGVSWNGTNISDGGGTVTASGSTTTAASTLVAHLCCESTDSITPTTPSGWTQREASSTQSFVYEKVNASAITTLVVSFTGGSGGPVNLILVEIKGTATTNSYDSTATPKTGTTTTPTTNGITTVQANTAILAFHSQRRGTATPPLFSSPTNSFVLVGSQNQQNDGTTSLLSAAYDRIVSSTQSALSTAVTSTVSTAWISHLVAYSDTASGGGATAHNLCLLGAGA